MVLSFKENNITQTNNKNYFDLKLQNYDNFQWRINAGKLYKQSFLDLVIKKQSLL